MQLKQAVFEALCEVRTHHDQRYGLVHDVYTTDGQWLGGIADYSVTEEQKIIAMHKFVEPYLQLPKALFLPYDRKNYAMLIEQPCLHSVFVNDVWSVTYTPEHYFAKEYSSESDDLAMAIVGAWLKMKEGEHETE